MFKSIKVSVLSFIIASCIIPSISFAQSISISDVDTSGGNNSSCVTIDNNLSYKNRKNNNKDDVTNLQDFLNSAGYLNADSVTGFFGKLTESAVAKFQSNNGLVATPPGFVGAGTRAKIGELSCGGIVTTPTSVAPSGIGYAGISGRYGNAGGTLPAGCRSASGFSPLTGQSCATSTGGSYPIGCISNVGYSSVTGQSCGGRVDPVMCTQEMVQCSDGSYVGRTGPNCEAVCSTTPVPTVSSVPTIEFIGQPTLKLQYDYAGKESMLVGRATIKVTAGNTPVDVSGFPYMVRLFMNKGITNSSNGTTYNTISNSLGSGTIIQGNSSATFTIEVKAPTRELLPGSYTLGSSLHTVQNLYTSISNPIIIMGETPRNVIEQSSYPPVTIIGETSPYITGAPSCYSTPTSYCQISGNRFDNLSNKVTINGVTRNLPSVVSPGGVNVGNYVINFTPSDFNLQSGVNYSVSVSTNKGLSNGNIWFTFTGNTTPTNSSVSAVVVEGPTLALKYDSYNKESSLIAKVIIMATAGSEDLVIGKTPTAISSHGFTKYLWPYFSVEDAQKHQSWSTATFLPLETYNLVDHGDYWTLQAGKSAKFSVSASDFNLKQMISGSYHVVPTMSYTVDGVGTFLLTNVPSGNYVTIIGETAPYITSISVDQKAGKTNGYLIYGSRLSGYENSVTINNITKVLPSYFKNSIGGISNVDTMIQFNPSDFNLVSGSHYIVQVSTNKGASNNFAFDFSENTTPTNSNVSFARTAGFTDQVVSPNTAGVKIGSFTIQNTSSVDYRIDRMSVLLTPSIYSISNISNLVLKSNGNVLGTPIGVPTNNLLSLTSSTMFSSNGFNFTEIIIPVNSSRTFDIYADIGGAVSGSVTTNVVIFPVTKGMYPTLATTDGVTVTSVGSSVSSLANPTLSPSSPVSQFVVGGSTFGIATFRLATVQAGTNTTVKSLCFSTTGQNAFTSFTVGGVTVPVVNNSASLEGLNIPISSNGIDIPVTVRFNGFQNSAIGGSLISGIKNVGITLECIRTVSGSGQVITNSVGKGDLLPVSSNNMTLVASKPTVIMASGAGSSPLVLGQENKIGEFTVQADANGPISLSQFAFTTGSDGISNSSYGQFRVVANGYQIPTVQKYDSKLIATFASPYQIQAGRSVTFSVYSVVSGSAIGGASILHQSTLDSNWFVWNDVIGGNVQYTVNNNTGNNIYNFPTNSYTTAGNGTQSTSTITVISPNGGEVWQKGTLQTVQYGVTNNPKNHFIKLKLFKGNTFFQDLVPPTAAGPIMTGPYGQTGGSLPWTVPLTLPDGSDYSVQAMDYDIDGTTLVSQDSSDHYFTITGTSNTPTVISPNGGETWTKGNSQTISWKDISTTSSPVSYDVSIVQNSQYPVAQIIARGVSSSSYTWSNANTPFSDGSYIVKVCQSGTTNCASSNAAFNITTTPTPTPTITVISPNGGETLTIGQIKRITWSSSNYNSNLNIGYYSLKSPGGSNGVVAVSIPNTGYYDWNTAGIAEDSQIKIRIYDPTTPTIYDDSDGYFSLANVPLSIAPKITSLAVLSGVLKVGDAADINFSSENTNYCHLYMTPPNSNEITLTEGSFSSKLVTTSPLTTPGNYRVLLYCWDQSGAAANQSTTFNVNPGAVLGAFTSNTSCIDLPYNLHRGAESTDVSSLQSFLFAKGLLTDTPTGFYGDKTVEGVKDYQASKGLPATGMVYDFTRQAIKVESCR